MPNTSRTGGYLVPSTENGNLEDKLFSEFLQPIIVGITGLTGPFVRPRWQAEPPNLPDFGTDWCAIGTRTRARNGFSYVYHVATVGDVPGTDNNFRVQDLGLLASFYGPNSDNYSDLLVQGFDIGQNREAMLLAGYSFVACDDPIPLADMLNERWTRRIDVGFTVRRGQTFTYPVLDLEGAQVAISSSNPKLPTQNVTVEE